MLLSRTLRTPPDKGLSIVNVRAVFVTFYSEFDFSRFEIVYDFYVFDRLSIKYPILNGLFELTVLSFFLWS